MSKKLTAILIFIIAASVFLFFSIGKNHKTMTKIKSKKDPSHDQKRQMASDNKAIKQTQKVDVEIQDRDQNPVDFLSLSHNDPIQSVLRKYGINPKNQLKVNYDTWFQSKQYVQMHSSEYFPDAGRVIESHDNYKVVQLAPGINSKNYPPLVISYATNRPVPITGDLLVKFFNKEELGDLINFLKQDGQFEDLVHDVIVTDELRDIRWILVKTKNKSQVMMLYDLLTKLVGQQNIEAVQPDNRPQLKY